MFLPLLLLLIIPPSLSGKSASRSKAECNFQLPVFFSSFNFNTTLMWKPPENVEGSQYTVRYKAYGTTEWQKKLECTNIILTQCDLTNEIKSNEEYIGRVLMYTATCKKSNRTEKFDPLLHSEIGPPTVNVTLENASIIIKLTHPVKYLHEQLKWLKYYININDREIETEDPYYVIEKTNPSTTYCITAKIYWFKKTSNLSEKKCITTNADHTTEQTIAWMIYILPVTLIICTVIAIGFGIYKYIHGSNQKQPKILNVTTSNNNNFILIDAYNVTMNIITIDCRKTNFQDTMKSINEEDKTFQNKNDLHIADGGDYMSCGTEVIDKAEIESKYDDEYVNLQEQVTPSVVTTAKPTISPYDMPHQPLEPVRPLSKSTISTDTVCEERDLYGNMKSNASLLPLQENDDLPDGYATEKSIVNYFYLPQGDSHFPSVSIINEDPYKLENSSMGQDIELVNVSEDTDLNESSTLFIDWTPDNPLYLPNLSKKRELENCIEQCKEERSALLCQLYLPPEEKGTSKDEELEQMEERWGLLVQNSET